LHGKFSACPQTQTRTIIASFVEKKARKDAPDDYFGVSIDGNNEKREAHAHMLDERIINYFCPLRKLSVEQ